MAWKMLPTGSGGDIKLKNTYVRMPRSTDPKIPARQAPNLMGKGAFQGHPGGGIPLEVGPKFREALATRKADRRAATNAYLNTRRDLRAQFKAGTISLAEKHAKDRENYLSRKAANQTLSNKMTWAHMQRAGRKEGYVAPQFVGTKGADPTRPVNQRRLANLLKKGFVPPSS